MITVKSDQNSIVINPVIFPDNTSQAFLSLDFVSKSKSKSTSNFQIVWDFENEREIFDIASLALGLKDKTIKLYLPYLPFARQDKEVTFDTKSTFNLYSFATLINSLQFSEVSVLEPHNIELTQKLINNCKIIREEFPNWLSQKDTLIVFPDLGALKRYSKVFSYQTNVIALDKSRNSDNGNITGIHLNEVYLEQAINFLDDQRKTIWIVDDIIDGGRTFTLCAQLLREKIPAITANDVPINLYTSHKLLSESLPIPGIANVVGRYVNRPMSENILLATDVYKLHHSDQYPPNTEYVYSYMIARSAKKWPYTVFYGLQYYLLKYLSGRLTQSMVEEFLDIYSSVMAIPPDEKMKLRLEELCHLGYLPLMIKALPEGTVVQTGNALLTVTNTIPGYGWLVGYVESLLLKVWNTCSVATFSHTLKTLCASYADKTCDSNDHLPFQIHDFGYRGCSSEETAALGGSAHLLNFKGTDTLSSVKLVKKYYGRHNKPFAASIPGTEHSVMSSYGKDNEFQAFERILDVYPNGPVSIVSDTYDFWNVMRDFLPKLKDKIEMRQDGKVVIRPDSGDPSLIILGDKDAKSEEERLGALRMLDKHFGSSINTKGYKVLNPRIGLVYGDGMYYERINHILEEMKKMGFASSNIVFGVGALLLQNRNRDEQSFAFKATSITVNGEQRDIYKDPVTDKGKRSHKGLLRLDYSEATKSYSTQSNVSAEEEKKGSLKPVFIDGILVDRTTFDDIKERLNR